MRYLLPLIVTFAFSACSQPLFSRGDSALVLVNQTSSPLLYIAIEREASNLVDPNPTWRVADHLERLLEPGEERAIAVEGYTRGDDVRVFLYPVGDRNGVAPLTKDITVTHKELRKSGYRVRVAKL